MIPSNDEKNPALPVIIVTYKDVFLWTEKYKGDLDADSKRSETQVTLSTDDLESLGINDSGSFKLTTEAGSIVAQAKADPKCPKGFGFMPIGLSSIRLSSYDPAKAKNPNFKRIEGTVERVD